jgi:hypothetical protein
VVRNSERDHEPHRLFRPSNVSSGSTRNPQSEQKFSGLDSIVLQNSKVAGPRIFREIPKQERITDSHNLNRIGEGACEFNVRR